MEVKNVDGVVVISGRVDTVTAEDFRAQAEKLMDAASGDVVFDCEALSYVSSSGLRALLILARKAKAEGRKITLKNLSEAVLEVLEVSGFDSFFEIEG